MTRRLRGEYILRLIHKYGWTIGAELGVWYGETYFRVLEGAENLTLIGVDNWDSKYPLTTRKDQTKNRKGVYEGARNFPGRAVIMEMDTAEAAEKIPDRSLDFVFIDADHSYEGCHRDIVNWLPKIKDIGWILGHDYTWPGVNRAVHELLNPVNCDILYTDETWARPKHLTGDNAVTICCIKWGDKYGPEYVNRLYRMVQKSVHHVGHDFVCFTEDVTGLDPNIRTAPLLCEYPGWWQKMGLYQKELPGVNTNKILFLDLDVALCNSLDPVLEMDSDFAFAKDWPVGKWKESDARDCYGNSSAILLRVGSQSRIWDRFSADPKKNMNNKRYPGDQEWINGHFFGEMDLMPETFVKSYKLHNLAGAERPDCSVVMFHGKPKPPDCGGWVREVWR